MVNMSPATQYCTLYSIVHSQTVLYSTVHCPSVLVISLNVTCDVITRSRPVSRGKADVYTQWHTATSRLNQQDVVDSCDSSVASSSQRVWAKTKQKWQFRAALHKRQGSLSWEWFLCLCGPDGERFTGLQILPRSDHEVQTRLSQTD